VGPFPLGTGANRIARFCVVAGVQGEAASASTALSAAVAAREEALLAVRDRDVQLQAAAGVAARPQTLSADHSRVQAELAGVCRAESRTRRHADSQAPAAHSPSSRSHTRRVVLWGPCVDFSRPRMRCRVGSVDMLLFPCLCARTLPYSPRTLC
jgi:hypothetical protein